MPEGYALVYQGGHHDVYCNGEEHIRTSGGWAGISKPGRFMAKFKCDCAKHVPERD